MAQNIAFWTVLVLQLCMVQLRESDRWVYIWQSVSSVINSLCVYINTYLSIITEGTTLPVAPVDGLCLRAC